MSDLYEGYHYRGESVPENKLGNVVNMPYNSFIYNI